MGFSCLSRPAHGILPNRECIDERNTILRNLKYAILGLVNREPMTGYDIKKAFDSRGLTNFWHAEHSQIYPELKKLVAEGLVEYETVIRGEKLETKLYEITDAGRKDFHDWLRDDVEIERTYKDIFRLRTFFNDSMSKEEYLVLLRSQLQQHIDKRDMLKAFLDTDFRKLPHFNTRQMGDYLVLDGAVRREKTYVEWLEHCIRVFETGEAGEDVPPLY